MERQFVEKSWERILPNRIFCLSELKSYRRLTGFLLSGAFCLGNGVLDIKQLPPVDLETTSDAIVLAIAAVGGLAFMLRTGVLE